MTAPRPAAYQSRRNAKAAFRCGCAAAALLGTVGMIAPAHAQIGGNGMIVENIPHMPPGTMIVENIPHMPSGTMIVENVPQVTAPVFIAPTPFATPAAAAGQGTPVFSSGTGSIVQTAARDTININSAQAIIDWSLFDTGIGGGDINFLNAGTELLFTSAADYTVLNRIIPTDQSRAIRFDGTVTSQISGASGGNIWFYSPGGIVVGTDGIFDVGSLVLTTNDIDTSGGSLFGSSGEIRFRGAANSTSAVVVEAGAQLNATNAGSYLALVAPRVVQGGIVDVNGSVAYVAAEQADLTINNGLFDIAVTVGTTDENGVVHNGTTTGQSSTGALDTQAVYMVAIPKNDAITMLIGGDIGYRPASSATIENGRVVLSAGADIVAGDINRDVAAISSASIDFTGGTLNADTTAFATEAISAMLTNGQTLTVASGTTSYDLNLEARDRVDFGGIFGGGISVDGNVSIVSGGSQSIGDVNIATGGTSTTSFSSASTASTTGGIRIAGALNIDVSSNANTGGTGIGGNVTFDLNGGSFTADSLNISADGIGRNNGSSAISPLALSAFAAGLALLPPASSADGGDGVGGDVVFNLDLGAGSSTVANLSVSANGFGGNGDPGDANLSTVSGHGGSGTGGNATFNALSGTLTVTNTLTISATGTGGSGGFGSGVAGGNGGAAIGGSATFNMDGTASIGTNTTIVSTNAIGGAGGGSGVTFNVLGAEIPSNIGGIGGDATGGTSIYNDTAGTHDFGSITVSADATGGTGGTNSGITVGDARADGGRGGNAFGGSATINLNQALIDTSSYTVSANAIGGGGGGGLNAGNGGNADGGVAALNINNVQFQLNNPTIRATAIGGNGGFSDGPSGNGGNGGNAVGGTARLVVTGPAALATINNLSLSVSGTGGNGGNGGNAALDADDGGNGGNGGNGTGGTAEILAVSGSSIDVSMASLLIFNRGRGGNGGNGGSNFSTSGTGNGGNGGDAGNGTGGTSRLTVDGGTISTNIVQLSSDGTGGNEGTGGSSGGALAGLDGIGGDGTGGAVEVSAVAGGTLSIAKGVASIGAVLTLGASGTGTSASDQSGDGTGGSVSVLADGGFIDILGTAVNGDVFRANGNGGSGATNVGSGFGGQIDVQVINGGSIFQSPAANPAQRNRLLLEVNSNGGNATADIGGLADGSGGSISLISSGGSVSADQILFRIDAFAGDGGDGFAGGNAFGGDTFTLIENSAAGDPSSFNTIIFQILNRAFGGVGGASGNGGDGFGGNVTMTVSGDSVITGLGNNFSGPQFSVFGIGGGGGDTIDAATPAGQGGNGIGGNMDIIIQSGIIDVQGFSMITIGSGGAGGDYIDAVASGLAGQAGDGGDGTAGRVTIDMTGGTLSSNSIFNWANGSGGTGGDADVGIAGNGGAGTGGQSEVNFASAGNSVITTGAVGQIAIQARGDGGRAGQSANGSGGDAGAATGGTAIATIDNGATVESLIFTVDTTGRGFAGGINTLAAGGPGGLGGTGIGGSSTLDIIDGTLIAGDMFVLAPGLGGVGGDSADGVGGNGGDAIGGSSNILVRSGSNLSMSLFKRFGFINNGADSQGTAGDGGTGAQGGGDGGNGTGGTATAIAQGGMISSFTGFSFAAFDVLSNGIGGDGGGDPLGAGGDGTGGLSIMEIQEGSPGIINVGNTRLQASGIGGSGNAVANTIAGRVQLSDTSIDPLGLMNMASLSVQALGTVALPTSGFFMAGNSGPTAVAGNFTVNTSGNIEFAFDGDGQVTVGGNADFDSTAGSILISHTNNTTPVNSIDVSGTFDANAALDFNSMAGSTVNAGDSVTVQAEEIAADTLLAGGLIDLLSGGGVSLGIADAGTTVAISAVGDVSFASITAGDSVMIDTAGSITGTDLTAGGVITAEGTDGFEVDTLSAGGNTALRSLNGAVIVNIDTAVSGDLIASGAAILLNAINDLAVTDARATNGDIDIIAGGNLTVSQALSVGNIALTSTDASVTAGNLEAGLVTVAPATAGSGGGLVPLGRVVGSPGVGDITITAAVDAIITDDALANNDLFIIAGGLIDIQALATGVTISTDSADLDIRRAGQLGESDFTQSINIVSNGTNQMVLGGTGSTGTFSLDADEFTRIFSGGDLFILALGTAGTDPSMIIEDLSPQVATGGGGPQDGNIGAAGTLTFASEDDLRINGALELTGATANNTLALISDQNIRLDAAAGLVSVLDANGGLVGQLNVSAQSIVAATDSAAADIAGATVANADIRLANNDGIVRDAGFFMADSISFVAETGLFIQNSGAGTDFDDRRGFTVGDGGIAISSTMPGNTIGIVINGVQQMSNGTTVTGIDMIGQTGINTGFAAASTINGCLIAAPTTCGVIIDTTPETPDIPIQDLVEEEIEEDKNGARTPLTPLIETVEIFPNREGPIIDDPVTGAGNEDLWIRNQVGGGNDD